MTKDEIIAAVSEALAIETTDVKIVRTNSFGIVLDIEVELDDHEEDATDLDDTEEEG